MCWRLDQVSEKETVIYSRRYLDQASRKENCEVLSISLTTHPLYISYTLVYVTANTQCSYVTSDDGK